MQTSTLATPKSKTHRTRKTGADASRAGLTALPVHLSALWPPVFSIMIRSRIMIWPAWPSSRTRFSEPIQDLVGPEPLEAMQRLVQRRELLVGDAADLLHRLDVLLVERVDDLADFLAPRGQADADRAAIDARALMIEEAELDELLEVIGDVGAEVITARAQFARGQLLVAGVIEQPCLHRIDVGGASAIELLL